MKASRRWMSPSAPSSGMEAAPGQVIERLQLPRILKSRDPEGVPRLTEMGRTEKTGGVGRTGRMGRMGRMMQRHPKQQTKIQ